MENPPAGILTAPLLSTILLVEDELMVREATRRSLKSAGYTVLEASAADEAIRVAAAVNVKINLLLTDLVMHGMDGLTLSRHLRRLYPSMSTILMSGYPVPEMTAQSARSDNMVYLQKPFTLNRLFDLVAKAIAATHSGIIEEQLTHTELSRDPEIARF
jgi:two-component system cell cycle sensor histidine kinase/response regulator CckA